jgi:hypothetical protein
VPPVYRNKTADKIEQVLIERKLVLSISNEKETMPSRCLVEKKFYEDNNRQLQLVNEALEPQNKKSNDEEAKPLTEYQIRVSKFRLF